MSHEEDEYAEYLKEYSLNKDEFVPRIEGYENKAYEYGVLVIKNAILVSGGGLLSVPTIIGLSSTKVVVDIQHASQAGMMFAASLILGIVSAYIIYLNWTLLAKSEEKHWADRAELLRKMHVENCKLTPEDLAEKDYYKFRINFLFLLPQFLLVIYLMLIVGGFINLYKAFGVS